MGRVKKTLGFAAAAGLGYALWRKLQGSQEQPDLEWEPQPFPYPPRPVERPVAVADPVGTVAAEPARPTTGSAWAEPVDGACPPGFPIKGKLSSGIFHVPGGRNYDRTKADRCYRDAAAAIEDGMRAAAN